MTRFSDRVILLHQKDFPADAPQPLDLYQGIVSPTESIDMAVFEERKNTLLLHRDRHWGAADPRHRRRRRQVAQPGLPVPRTGPHHVARARIHPPQPRRLLGQIHRHHLALTRSSDQGAVTQRLVREPDELRPVPPRPPLRRLRPDVRVLSTLQQGPDQAKAADARTRSEQPAGPAEPRCSPNSRTSRNGLSTWRR